jgi:hypothetical protein
MLPIAGWALFDPAEAEMMLALTNRVQRLDESVSWDSSTLIEG